MVHEDDQTTLSESILASLAADERVVSSAERQLVQAIVGKIVTQHGPDAGQSVIEAFGQVIGQRLVEQLGQAVAERVSADLLSPAVIPALIPGLAPEPVDPGVPHGPPPVFPDPEPPPPPPTPEPTPPPPPPPPPPPTPEPTPPPPPPTPEPTPPPPPPTPEPPVPYGPAPYDPPIWPPHPIGPFGPFGPYEPHPIAPIGPIGPFGPFWRAEMEGGEGRPSEIVIPPEFVKLEGVLNEDDLNAVLAWSRDHHGQFITETVLTPDNGPDVATENTVRVLDDLGELGARIAARIRDEVLVAATHGGPTGMPGEQPRLGDSVALRMFEVDAEFEIHPPASDTGIGVVLYLTVPTTPRLRLHEGRQMGDTAVAGANSVEVATEANVAVVFAAQNTVVVNAGIEPSDAEDRSCALVIAGHLGA